ncbi:50S ribosomal protein L23 [Candidatus Saccharibacteria bacterium RIFCSPLOWO2_01_FULL_49_22]|nr:MAG: 50S ribosomal protein L23 [Candidatus Saccharibacteria bacterium RIFCSPLOWO2_01_FULL_49_22]
MSEKAYSLSEEHNTYVFDVPAQANKQMVAEAVAVQYQVSVDSVRIAKTAAKTRRSIKRRGRNIYRGESSGIRKAYVRLAKDQTLPIFAADKEAEAKAEKVQQTAEKAIAKETQKEGKTRRGFFGRKASDRTSIRGNK